MNVALFPKVVVNGQIIPSEAIAAEAQNHAAPRDKPGWAWRKAARALTVRTLLLQEAARQGLEPQPRELGAGRRETAEEALVRQLLEEALETPPPSEAEVRAVHAAAPERFRSPTLFEASHILFAAPPGDVAAREDAARRATAALDAIRAKPNAFRDIACAQSDCPSRSAGGRLGQISPGDTAPEFEAALAGLGEGEVSSAPVESRYGFHLIRCDARAEGAVLPFETVRPRIAAALEKAAWARAAREFVAALAERAEIIGIDLSAPVEAGRKEGK